MTLYELSDEYLRLLEYVEDSEIDDDVIRDTLEGLTGEIEDKVNGYCGVIAQLNSDANGLEEQICRMTDRKATLDRNIRRLKQSLQDNMELIGKQKIKTPLFSVWVQKNAPTLKLDIEDAKQLPAEYLVPQEPKVDKAKIKEELKAGAEFDFAHLEQSKSLRIR